MPNPPPHRRPHRDDLAIAAAGLVGGLLLWSFGLYNSPALERGPLVLLPLLAMCAAEVMRRTAQPWALLLACAALAGDQMTGSLLVTVLMFTDVVYAAVMYGPPRTVRAVPVVSVTVTVAGTLTVLAALRTPVALLLGVTLGLVTIGPAFTGVVTRTHRDAAAAERLRADQTRLLAEVDRVQAVTAERNRVARELHDVIANHLSAAALHSTAALAGDDPAADRAALRVVRENATQGLTEMRRLIGLLREGVTDDPAPPRASTGSPPSSSGPTPRAPAPGCVSPSGTTARRPARCPRPSNWPPTASCRNPSPTP
ncbi:histidine kinase dimerization/phosphoacceptor domain-containing protein [Streptomyces sp. RFCAC02]|uniref:sensor histidine kinase n=1 Tax=Streptomyces sp. RFCAC02 TaxID=2499143 RepID=UPI00320B9D03